MPAFSLVLALAVAQAAPAAGVTEQVRKGLDYCYRQQYDSAATTTARLLHERPGDPAAWFWQASLIQMLVYDGGKATLVDSFFRLSDRSLKLCREALARDPKDVQANFYYGMTQLNRANMLSWRQDRVAALRAMLDVSGRLRTALKCDPGFSDAWFGIGMVEYAQSMVNKYLPGGGSRTLAYYHVRLASRYGVLCGSSADFALVWMLAQDKKRDSAVSLCRAILARYPGSRSALRLLRDVYFDKGEYGRVLETGRELEVSISAAFPDNKYGMAENWLKMAKACSRLGDRDSALLFADRILAWEKYRNQVPWLPNYLREAADLKRRLE